jgi:peptidoglycan/xylan/chitin deacetylase (PgdA/CDA1 family)
LPEPVRQEEPKLASETSVSDKTAPATRPSDDPAQREQRSYRQAAKRQEARRQAKAGQRLSLAELRAKYPHIFKINGPSRDKRVALTFDDGPDRTFTPQILNVLKQYNVKATFFLIGRRAAEHPDIVRRIVREGHVVGNHSYSHPLFTKLTVGEFARQIGDAESVLTDLTGYAPKFVRPPYGEITEEQLLWADSRHYTIVNWNVDSLDWKQLRADLVAQNIIGNVKAGAIVLQHSAGGDGQDLSGTVLALPRIIESLRAEGYRLVTIPELLSMPAANDHSST